MEITIIRYSGPAQQLHHHLIPELLNLAVTTMDPRVLQAAIKVIRQVIIKRDHHYHLVDVIT
jgi:hypothetical protein